MTETTPKKELTQAQVEHVLSEQFRRTQDWQFWLYILVIFVPFTLLALWGFGDVHVAIRIAVCVVLGITLWKCEQWVVARRIRKTIEAMKAL